MIFSLMVVEAQIAIIALIDKINKNKIWHLLLNTKGEVELN